VLDFDFEDVGQRGDGEPGRGDDVGSSLLFEEEREPEGERGGKRWVERFRGTLGVVSGQHAGRKGEVALVWGRSIEDVLPCSYTPGSAQGRLTPSRSRP